jgi:hypothetical protein
MYLLSDTMHIILKHITLWQYHLISPLAKTVSQAISLALRSSDTVQDTLTDLTTYLTAHLMPEKKRKFSC